MTTTGARNHVWHVHMIDDDNGAIAPFMDYCGDRGDICGHSTHYANDEKYIKGLLEGGGAVDLLLLDMRLPADREEQRRIKDPAKRRPRGALLAEHLAADRATCHVPIVAYTQYAEAPDVARVFYGLTDLENVVDAVPARPDPSVLTHIWVEQFLDHDRFLVQPYDLQEPAYKLTAQKPCELKAENIRLNGMEPVVLEPLRDPLSFLVAFHQGALFSVGGKLHNYLVVKEREGEQCLPTRDFVWVVPPPDVDW